MGTLLSLSDIPQTTKVPNSAACGTCKANKMEGVHCFKKEVFGQGRKKILIIGENPTSRENSTGSLLMGYYGDFLKSYLRRYDYDMEEDIWFVHAVSCRKSNVTSKDVEYCRPWIWKFILKHKPVGILLLGDRAVDCLYGHRWKHGAIDGVWKWRGFPIPDQELNCWVMATYAPDYVMKAEDKPNGSAVRSLFDQDLNDLLLHVMRKKVPKFKPLQDCVSILSEHDTLSFLQGLMDKPRLIAFDYETNGLKPQREGHKIVCCSIADSKKSSKVFMMTPKIATALSEVLANPKIKKIAAYLSFEHIWTATILHTVVQGWVWDTVMAAHTLDNRPGISGVKFQSLIHFGVADYDSVLKGYLKAPEANGFNRIEEIDEKDLLIYCGIDSLVEYRLAFLQRRAIRAAK